MFCPECKSLMFPSNGKFVCRKCNTLITIQKNDETITTIKQVPIEKELKIFENSIDTLPKTKVECQNCHNSEAYYVLRQMRAADEPETKLYRCTKCGYSWRE